MERDSLLEPEVSSVSNEFGSLNLRPPPFVKVYKRRWYILAVYSFYSLTQGMVWNTWSPIAHPAEVAFDWTDADIALLSNYGCITMVFIMGVFSWMIVTKGLRSAMLVNGALPAVGCAIRCVTLNTYWFTVLAQLGAVLNGFSALGQGGCAIVSSIWFPPNERVTATAIGSSFNYLGVAVSYLVGAYMVHDFSKSNRTANLTDTYMNPESGPLYPGYDDQDVEKARENIMSMMYLHAALGVASFLLIVIYFPDRPKHPPCVSASLHRVEFGRGTLDLLKKPSFWQVVLPYTLIIGVYGDWSGLIDVNLKGLNISQTDAGWMGFFCIVSASAGGIILARMNDMFQRHMKSSLIFINVASAILFTWFALMVQTILEPNLLELYISSILASFLVGGSMPIYTELCCETAYPTSEAVASGVQMILVNFVGTLFYLVFFIPNIGTNWMNWTQLAVILPSIPLIAFYKEKYARLNMDEKKDEHFEKPVIPKPLNA